MSGFRKSKRARRTLSAALLLFFLAVGCGGEEAAALREFREAYSARHEGGDVDGLLELIRTPGDDPDLARRLRHALAEEVRWPLFGIAFEPIPAGEARALARALPATPQWRVHITLDTEDQFTSVWLAGMTDEGVRLLLPGTGPDGL